MDEQPKDDITPPEGAAAPKRRGRPPGAKNKIQRPKPIKEPRVPNDKGIFERKKRAPQIHTEEFGKRLEYLYKYGVPLAVIAKMEGVTEQSVRLVWGEKIDASKQDLNAQVAHSLFINATQKMNIAAQIFWLKCRAGWKDYDTTETRPGLSITLQSAGPRPSQIHIQSKVAEGNADAEGNNDTDTIEAESTSTDEG